MIFLSQSTKTVRIPPNDLSCRLMLLRKYKRTADLIASNISFQYQLSTAWNCRKVVPAAGLEPATP